MRIVASYPTCVAAGQCVVTDPDAFDQDEEGTVIVLRERPTTDEEIALADEAVRSCPSGALSLVED
ncbi:ferredoxin [Georgenia sp. 10Sc9-8]|uniref:Ferredoxin n=1 Tax=Georgenia halotolerans TaxID=3028317 RepID=A0ABT5TYR9_9MICO|nr:ferredoxin [Georgenia halotolerans]